MEAVRAEESGYGDNSIKGIQDEELLDFIERNLQDVDPALRVILSVDNAFSIDNLPQPDAYRSRYDGIVNLRKCNDIRGLTGFFCAVNNRLEAGGMFITCVETSIYRKERLYKKFPVVLNTLYYTMDYLAKRVAHKLPVLRNAYFFITAGRNRVFTSVEILGRLAYCGFEIKKTKRINNYLYILVSKREEKVDLKAKKYGFLFRMERAGQNGKTIMVYKVRTMHAYSEYIQDYIHATNNLDKGGKFKDDYRVTFAGRLFRKLWLDEVPMIYNFIKGDIKLVGVRPLSKHYLSLYNPEVVERRNNHKPGLIPPYYADLPETLDEIMLSEMKYFDHYEKSPLRTDILYLFKALRNILIKRARSK